jgi:hypothetical protein
VFPTRVPQRWVGRVGGRLGGADGRCAGRYHETYYLWLRLHHESDRFVVTRYTLPPVVPVLQLARELLPTNLTVRGALGPSTHANAPG